MGMRRPKRWSRDSPGEDHGDAGCPLAANGAAQWSRYPPAVVGMDPHWSSFVKDCTPWGGPAL